MKISLEIRIGLQHLGETLGKGSVTCVGNKYKASKEIRV